MKFIHEKNRIYVLNQNNKIIVLATFVYLNETTIDVNHTFVDQELRGQGIASLLMHEVYNYAKERNYKIKATCPYAILWFERNENKRDILI